MSNTDIANIGCVKMMTSEEEKLVTLGICPRCVPHEGEPGQMRLFNESNTLRVNAIIYGVSEPHSLFI